MECSEVMSLDLGLRTRRRNSRERRRRRRRPRPARAHNSRARRRTCTTHAARRLAAARTAPCDWRNSSHAPYLLLGSVIILVGVLLLFVIGEHAYVRPAHELIHRVA